MIGLRRGTYLGQADKLQNADGIIASITSYPDTNYSESLHYHETLHLSLVLTGGNLEKRAKDDIERLPGVVTFYDAGEYHRSTKTRHASKHFNIEIENDFLQQYEIDVKAANIRSLKGPDATLLMLKILKELQIADEYSKNSVHALMLNFLRTTVCQSKFDTMPSWLGIIYELMQDRWSETLSLKELSAAANVHPVTVSKFFPKYFGCTIGEYMRKVKVDKALGLIKTSSYSLTEIAASCGFADQSHFIRTFRQQTGFVPGHYQKHISVK